MDEKLKRLLEGENVRDLLSGSSEVVKEGMYKGVKIPVSKKDWLLFSDPASGQAAKELTKALKKALDFISKKKELDEGVESAAELLGKAYDKFVYPIMVKYDNQGATDSESRYKAQQSLVDFAKIKLGITWYDSRLSEYMD